MKSTALSKIKNYEEITSIAAREKALGKRVVFVVGTFDITHLGHMVFFEQAKQAGNGDILIVGTGPDRHARTLKGDERPIYTERVRAAMIAYHGLVDYVVILDEELKPHKDNHSELISLIKPDVFVVNDDDSALEMKKSVIEKEGGIFIAVPRELPEGFDYISTTAIYEKIKNVFKD